MEKPEPQPEHQWLQQLVGEWTMEEEAECEPGKPPVKSTGTDSVRSIGGLWIVCDGQGQMPDGAPASWMMMLGYDPAKQKFVGTWIGSMMPNMWVYEGELDESGRVLSLNSEVPGCEGKIEKFKDVIEFVSDDHRVHTSHAQQPDGSWKQFMRADYRRTK